jgi:hypothetical protein
MSLRIVIIRHSTGDKVASVEKDDREGLRQFVSTYVSTKKGQLLELVRSGEINVKQGGATVQILTYVVPPPFKPKRQIHKNQLSIE